MLQDLLGACGTHAVVAHAYHFQIFPLGQSGAAHGEIAKGHVIRAGNRRDFQLFRFAHIEENEGIAPISFFLQLLNSAGIHNFPI
jgi:hypothetical protein